MTHITQHHRIYTSVGAQIPAEANLKRLPLAPGRKRTPSFWDSFEDTAFCYDCFRTQDGKDVLIVCPPPLNLLTEIRAIRVCGAGRSENYCVDRYVSRSTMTLAVRNVPPEVSSLAVRFGTVQFSLDIGANHSEAFAGRNVLVTMNKNNDLDWVAAWARWHHKMHDADACVFFDNGSDLYSPQDILDTLASFEGLKQVAVLSWPQKYGRKDPAILDRPHYAHFLQVSSLVVALRRFASRAGGLLNCDIDELVSLGGNGSIFNQARTSAEGIVTLRGTWVEPVRSEARQPIPHLHYRHKSCLPFMSVCADKWVLDPSRSWIQTLSATPSVHRIYDVPKDIGRRAPKGAFWHFKAINTGWKEERGKKAPHRLLLKRLMELDKEAEAFNGAPPSNCDQASLSR